MMNGDVKGSHEDLTSSTQDKEDSTGNNMDTKVCHTKALSTNHCDNSNSSIESKVKSESAAQPDDKLMENSNSIESKVKSESAAQADEELMENSNISIESMVNSEPAAQPDDELMENSNSINSKVKSEPAAQPDELMENNTCDTTDQTDINYIDNLDASSTCKVKDRRESNASNDIQPKIEPDQHSCDGEIQDSLLDGDAHQETNDKEKHPAVDEPPPKSPKIEIQEHSPFDDRHLCDEDSNEQADGESPNEEKKKITNNDGAKDQAKENSKDTTSTKRNKQINSGKKCNIPIQNDPYFRAVVSDDDSELDLDDEGDQDSELDDDDDEVEEAVSINSESDIENIDSSSQDSQNKSDIVIIDDNKDRRNGNSSRNMSSPEIHEITSDMDDDDDCILDEDNISDKFKNHKNKRMNKARQKHNGDNSDIEEVEVHNDGTKKSKLNTTPGTTATKNSKDTEKKGNNNDIYQAIAARGTTVTPFNPKATQQNNTAQQQQAILPSLTDDMFVVEAPSFIVPYVYEKPSMKPFREFVDKLGREIEEKQLKEEKERLEREKEEKERKEKERQEKRERGEPVSEDEVEENAETPKKETQKKGKRMRRNEEDDDVSWDGSTSTDSDDEGLSDDNKMEVSKEKDDCIEEIKDVASLPRDKIITSVPDNYFDCTLGKFFMDIGVNLVQEYVQNDLLKTQNRKLSREKKHGHNTKAVESSINSLMKNLELSKENNAPFNFEYKKCEFCSFRTESKLIMANHLETPHMRNNLHRCNFCPFEVKSAHDILFHMDAEHNIKGKLERAPAYHQCVNCLFEDSGKGKLARHQIACAKRFKPDFNLAPPLDWEPPAKIPKLTKARNTVDYNAMARGQVMNVPIRGNINQMHPSAGFHKNRPRAPIPRALPPLTRAPTILRGNSVMPGNMGGFQATKITAGGSKSCQPSLSITPLPRAPVPFHLTAAQQAKGTFVICEICDGYIKDLEQLRNHMQWIHKVKIHPKMIFNRPPLNCQKCQFRFFTDQGLERHLLGAHGLVTSSMQEAANKGKDAGRCPVCGKVYQWKLLNHVARDHSLTLKPAHLSYKCTVCTATFGMYKLFENHVYSAHRVVAKKATDKPPAKDTAAPKPLKINDEITVIPQPSSGVKRK